MKRGRFGSAIDLVRYGIMFDSRMGLLKFQDGSDTGARNCAEILLLHERLFRGREVQASSLWTRKFHLSFNDFEELFENENIQHMNLPAKYTDLNPIERV